MRIKLALALLLVATSASALTERHVHQTLNLDPNGRFSLDTHNGSVTITTWNQAKVDIDARIEAGDSDALQEDIDATEIRISGGGSSVDVQSNYDRIGWRHSGWIFGGESRSLPPVHYTISVPATAMVRIEDHNASVRVTGLQGDLRVNGHNGSIEVANHSGAANITAHNGDVHLEFARFSKPTQIETHNGTIDIKVPSDARFELDASGHHLGVDSDLPITVRETNRDSYRGNVNGGGALLKIETHNGSVRLRRS
jgi:hypothetical protein